MAGFAYFKYWSYSIPVHLKNFENSWNVVIRIDHPPPQVFLVKELRCLASCF